MEEPTIYSLIERYYEQIDLFYYQNQRELPRPKTKAFDVIVWGFVYLVVVAACILLNISIKLPMCYEIPVSIIVYLLLSELLLRFIVIKIVECYQHYAKEETRRKCLCVPSCSEYAIMCLKKYELVYGLLKISKRVFVTCKGDEYIIDYP